MDTARGHKLKTKRQWLGLTQKDLAIKCGVTKGQVQSAELGCESQGLPQIEAFLEHNLPDISEHIIKLTAQQIALRNKALERTFEIGKKYSIRETSYGVHSRGAYQTFNGTTWHDDCIFEYIGKQGIHHCFKEIHGDWSRTYTDPQLIGKKIMEV